MTDTDPRRASWVFEPAVGSVAELRRLLRALLGRWDLPADVVDDALLVATELVTNAVVHAGTRFHVVVEVRAPVLCIAVADGGTRPPPRGPRRGAGLRIVNRTTLRWGWREYDTGKTVWAEVLI